MPSHGLEIPLDVKAKSSPKIPKMPLVLGPYPRYIEEAGRYGARYDMFGDGYRFLSELARIDEESYYINLKSSIDFGLVGKRFHHNSEKIRDEYGSFGLESLIGDKDLENGVVYVYSRSGKRRAVKCTLGELWDADAEENEAFHPLSGKREDFRFGSGRRPISMSLIKNEATGMDFLLSNEKFTICVKDGGKNRLMHAIETMDGNKTSTASKPRVSYIYKITDLDGYVNVRDSRFFRLSGSKLEEITKDAYKSGTGEPIGFIGRLRKNMGTMKGRMYTVMGIEGAAGFVAINYLLYQAIYTGDVTNFIVGSIGINIASGLSALVLMPKMFGVKWANMPNVKKMAAKLDVKLRKVGIADVEEPNAFAYGMAGVGGNIAFTKGIFEKLKPREMVAVLQHELGHIRRNATTKFLGLSIGTTLLYAIPIALNDYSLFWLLNLGLIGGLYMGGGTNRIVRYEESKADEFAAKHGLSEYLKTGLLKIAKTNNFSIEGSHPSVHNRIKRLDCLSPLYGDADLAEIDAAGEEIKAAMYKYGKN